MAGASPLDVITVSDSDDSLDGTNIDMSLDGIFTDVGTVCSVIKNLYPDTQLSLDLIFDHLEQQRTHKNRIEKVIRQILPELPLDVKLNDLIKAELQHGTNEPPIDLTKYNHNKVADNSAIQPVDFSLPSTSKLRSNVTDGNVTSNEISDYEKLLIDSQKVMDEVENVEFDEVCSRLESKESVPDRVERVIHDLKGSPTVPLAAEGGNVNVKRDLEVSQSDTIPKKVKVECETTPGETNLMDVDPTVPCDNPSNGEVSTSEDSNNELQEKLETLKETFPDADPDFLMEVIVKYDTDEMAYNAKVSELLENPNYPKLRVKQQREKMERMMKAYLTRVYTPEDVLQWFDDPVKYFSDIDRPVTDSYRQHATLQIYNDFPKLTLTSVNLALSRCKWHYCPTHQYLKELDQIEKPLAKYKRRKARVKTDLPAIPDELFYKELAFTRIRPKFEEYICLKKDKRNADLLHAKLNRSFLTCQCCFDEELLISESVDCGAGHFFCEECVRRGAEVATGQSLCHLSCMADGCNLTFPLTALQRVLKPSVFSNWLIRLQAEEVSKANIPDLVQCLHCSFAAIMPNPDDKVFKCLNPECLKETCRLCKEPNHVPLRCDEIEKGNEVKMRTYIENKMTEALIRVCSNCQKSFTKAEGCNMMRCICGQFMCYVCRQPIKDYSHFGPNGCPQDVNTEELHRKEAADGGAKAKQELLEQHPELSNLNLKYDPTVMPSTSSGNQEPPFQMPNPFGVVMRVATHQAVDRPRPVTVPLLQLPVLRQLRPIRQELRRENDAQSNFTREQADAFAAAINALDDINSLLHRAQGNQVSDVIQDAEISDTDTEHLHSTSSSSDIDDDDNSNESVDNFHHADFDSDSNEVPYEVAGNPMEYELWSSSDENLDNRIGDIVDDSENSDIEVDSSHNTSSSSDNDDDSNESADGLHISNLHGYEDVTGLIEVPFDAAMVPTVYNVFSSDDDNNDSNSSELTTINSDSYTTADESADYNLSLHSADSEAGNLVYENDNGDGDEGVSENEYTSDYGVDNEIGNYDLENGNVVNEDVNSVSEDSNFGHEDVNSVSEDSNFGHEDVNSVSEDSNFGHEDSNFGHEDVNYSHEDVNFGHEDSNFGHEDVNSVSEDSNFGHEDVNSVSEDSNFGHEDSNFGHEDSNFGHEDSNFGHEDNLVILAPGYQTIVDDKALSLSGEQLTRIALVISLLNIYMQ
ncbi:hypothetical protein CHUAL_004333 [Chamberlinius hualienensis]